jgi:molybdate transport system substrate-binding protein
MLRRSFLVVFVVLIAYSVSFGSKLIVIYTPSMKKPIEKINELFKNQYKDIEITSIPTIARAAFEQIKNGYPADIFISADTLYPKKLIEQGFALENSYFVYAKDVLVLYSNISKLDKTNCIGNVEKARGYIGIINPVLGPYGKATVQALENAHSLDLVQKRFVQGKDALQVLWYAKTNNASLVFLPLSLVIGSKEENYCIVGKELYLPIQQAMVILNSSKNKSEAYKYLELMKSKKVEKILEAYDFET